MLSTSLFPIKRRKRSSYLCSESQFAGTVSLARLIAEFVDCSFKNIWQLLQLLASLDSRI
jgi:hypothetical protein